MAFQPLRMANSTAFTSMLDPNINAELTADMASKGLGAMTRKQVNKINTDLEIQMAKAGQKSGGFDLGSGLSMLAGGLNMAKGFGLFGGGGKSDFASSFTSKNFTAPDYMSGAGNFSSFFG